MSAQQIIGFSGSKHGINAVQRQNLGLAIKMLTVKPAYGVHGCCVGGDEEFHRICRKLGIPLIGYPATVNDRWKMQLNIKDFMQVYDAKPPLVRNGLIVEESNRMFFTPNTNEEVVQSGTWHSVRLARKKKVPHVIFFPDNSSFYTQDYTP